MNIVAAVRTPIGRYGGSLASIRPDDLAALVMQEAVRRAGGQPDMIDDVFFGCTNQAGEDNRNVARMSALLAGLPTSVTGVTVNRLCGSGLEAVNQAAAAARQWGGVYLAGGVESMTRAPFVMPKSSHAYERQPVIYDTTLGWRFTNPRWQETYPPFSMGETAENVADRHGISRERQDQFACTSQEKARAAIQAGRFQAEILPVPVKEKKSVRLFDTDEHPRTTNLEQLAQLKPVFREGGTVTAGNSSGINDGAAALVVASDEALSRWGLTARARVVSWAVAGVDPAVMGIAPVPAVEKALARAGLTLDEMDLIELNEAFAAQALACMDRLGLDPSKTNVNGGAIALGHPLGASGARILTTLLYELERRDLRYGLAAMCIGMGQGIATIIERRFA